MHAAAVSDRIGEFGDQAVVALITFGDRSEVANYMTKNELSFPVLIDPGRVSYTAYGLRRATLLRVWGFRAARRYIDIVLNQGFSGLSRPTDDTRQLGGDFVVGSDGTLEFGHWSEGPEDRPSVDTLVDVVRRLDD